MVSNEEPELPEAAEDLVRYPHDGDAVAAPRPAASNTLPNAEMTADVRTLPSGPG